MHMPRDSSTSTHDQAQSLLWWRGAHPQVGPQHRSQEEWDLHYLRIAREMSLMSKCASRQISGVLFRLA